MKGIILNDYRTADSLRYAEIPQPTPAANQVLVSIHATAVNHIDIGKASGAFKAIFPLTFPWTPGYDLAGVIEAAGDSVQGFKVGDEVYGTSLNGGTYAEYIAIDAQAIALKPRSLSLTEAASVPVPAETAEQVLFRDARITKGQTVLIHGAAGAVGSYAVQLAHRAGVKVIATASLKDKSFLEKLGADEVIDRNQPFESTLQQVDAVIDLVGGDVQERSYPVIKEGGILISVNQPVSAELAEKYKIRAVFSSLLPSSEGLTRIAGLIDGGELQISIGEVYLLQDTAEAWKKLKTPSGARKGGRIVLTIS